MLPLNICAIEDAIAREQRAKYNPLRTLRTCVSLYTQPEIYLHPDGIVDPETRRGIEPMGNKGRDREYEYDEEELDDATEYASDALLAGD